MTDLKCVRCGASVHVFGEVCRYCSIEMESIKPIQSNSTSLFQHNHPYPVPIHHPATLPTDSWIGPFDGVGDVLLPTFRLFTDNFWLITKLVLVIVVPLEIFKVVAADDFSLDWQFEVGTFLLQLLSNVLIAPALIFSLMKVLQTGEAPGVNHSYRWGFGKLPKLILCAALVFAAEAVGFMLCAVPGIAIAVAYSLVYPLAVLEKSSPMQVLRDTRDLTRGHRWKIFGAGFVVYAIVLAVNQALNGLATVGAKGYFAFWAIPLASITGDILSQAPTVLCLVIYLSIRRTLEAEYPRY